MRLRKASFHLISFRKSSKWALEKSSIQVDFAFCVDVREVDVRNVFSGMEQKWKVGVETMVIPRYSLKQIYSRLCISRTTPCEQALQQACYPALHQPPQEPPG